MRRRAGRYDVDQRRLTGPWLRRVALTVVAAGLVVAAEVLAALSAATPGTRHVAHPVRVVAHSAPSPYGGEPQLSQHPTIPRAPWKAAVRFVRDYSAWRSGTLGRFPRRTRSRA